MNKTASGGRSYFYFVFSFLVPAFAAVTLIAVFIVSILGERILLAREQSADSFALTSFTQVLATYHDNAQRLALSLYLHPDAIGIMNAVPDDRLIAEVSLRMRRIETGLLVLNNNVEEVLLYSGTRNDLVSSKSRLFAEVDILSDIRSVAGYIPLLRPVPLKYGGNDVLAYVMADNFTPDGYPVQAAIILMRVDWLFDLLHEHRDSRVTGTAWFAILDEFGNLLDERLDKPWSSFDVGALGIPDVNGAGVFSVTAEGKKYLITVTTLDRPAWTLLRAISRAEVVAPVRRLRLIGVITALFGILLSVVFARIASRRLLRPLDELREFIEEFAGGNRPPVHFDTRETAAIRNAFIEKNSRKGLVPDLPVDCVDGEHVPAHRSGLIAFTVDDMIKIHAKDPGLCLEQIAGMMCMSSSHIGRVYRSERGYSVNDRILATRLDMAAHLLTSTLMSVKEIACAVGFDNQTFFYRKFKERYGQTPRSFQAHVLLGSADD